MSSLILDPQTLNRDVYYRAVERVVERYKEKGKPWIDDSRERVFDTKFLGYVKKKTRTQEKYIVSKNPKLDNMESRVKNYTVLVDGFFTWCSCSIYRKSAIEKSIGRKISALHQICTHVGAALILKFYTEELFRE